MGYIHLPKVTIDFVSVWKGYSDKDIFSCLKKVNSVVCTEGFKQIYALFILII